MRFDPTAPPPALIPLPGAPAGGGDGRIKAAPADFVVEEIPAYEPSGEGDFHYLWIEKEDVSGPELARRVARRLGVPKRAVGLAGMKDRRAVTRQWVSVPADAPEPPEAVEGPVGEDGAIRLLRASRHRNKLRTGHLHGNRFAIRIRGRDPADDDRLAAVLEDASARGFANAFGAQRFSRGKTLELGMRALRGERIRDKRMLRLAVSAVQAWLFNHWLDRRVRDGLVERALEGDVLRKRDSGGIFVSDDADTDTARIAAGELVVTGPLPGRKYRAARGEAGAREAALLEETGMTREAFRPLGRVAPGTRRAALAWPEDASVARDGNALEVRFTLPSGSYATVLLGLLCGEGLLEGRPEYEK
ncbi:MAG: tRNA pseudouridine(13) synthase TruD [Myxococcota bacterium]